MIRGALEEWVSPPQARTVSVVGQELYDPSVKKVTFRADQARALLTKAACLGVTLLASVTGLPPSWPHEMISAGSRHGTRGRLRAAPLEDALAVEPF